MRPPLALLVLLPVLSFAPAALAQADARIAYLTRQLEKGRDARVRAQSALVLGATEDPDAMAPLCRGLEDPSELVRAAAAKALVKLQDFRALGCLKPRTGDSHPEARSAILEAVRTLEGFKARPPRFYLLFTGVVDRTSSLTPDLVRLAEQRLKRKLAAEGALLAGPSDSKAAAKSVLKQRRIKGFRLSAELHPLPGGGLRLALVCMTYPEQSILGQVNVKAAGAKPADLIRALAPKAIQEAAATFDWSP